MTGNVRPVVDARGKSAYPPAVCASQGRGSHGGLAVTTGGCPPRGRVGAPQSVPGRRRPVDPGLRARAAGAHVRTPRPDSGAEGGPGGGHVSTPPVRGGRHPDVRSPRERQEPTETFEPVQEPAQVGRGSRGLVAVTTGGPPGVRGPSTSAGTAGAITTLLGHARPAGLHITATRPPRALVKNLSASPRGWGDSQRGVWGGRSPARVGVRPSGCRWGSAARTQAPLGAPPAPPPRRRRPCPAPVATVSVLPSSWFSIREGYGKPTAERGRRVDPTGGREGQSSAIVGA